MRISLARINFEIDLPVSVVIDEQIRPFLAAPAQFSENIAYRIDHRYIGESLKLLPCNSLISYQGQKRCWIGEDCYIFYKSQADTNEYDFIVRLNKRKITFFTTHNSVELLTEPNIFLRRISAETLFLLNNRFILHSSLIEINGETILFSGPSQTGKSTQANLWKEFKQARILNGDRSCLVLDNKDPVIAYGLPYAGTSEIYVNEGYPVRAIVLLKQGKNNSIRRVSKIEALKFLLPEVSIPRIDEKLVQAGITLLSDVLDQVDVYELTATPDYRAVDKVYNELYGKLENS